MTFRWTLSERVKDVVRRGLETASLDPATHGIRIRLVRGAAQSSFTDGPEPGDTTIDLDGLRIFLDSSITQHAHAHISATAEHDQIVVQVSD